MDHLNETLADSGFHYTVETWQLPKPEAHETELERWVRENQLDDCPFCPENWPNLYMMYMMALPIHRSVWHGPTRCHDAGHPGGSPTLS